MWASGRCLDRPATAGAFDGSRVMVGVTVNGEPRQVEAGTSLETLIDMLGMDRRGLAIAVDEEVVPRSAWDAHALYDGSQVEILTIAQGG